MTQLIHRWLSRIALLAALAPAAVAAGCDTGGIYPLLDATDKLVPCGSQTSTWVASTTTGTHVFLIGSLTPATPLAVATRGCFAHAFVERDSSTLYESGTYAIDAAGQGDFTKKTSYVFEYQPGRPILSRDGSTEHEHDPPVTDPISIVDGAPYLVVTQAGVTSHLTNVYDLIASIDTSTQQGGEDLFRVLNLPLFTSQARMIGFGSGRMTRYVGAGTTFQGALDVAAPAKNEFSVRVQALTTPNTFIRYTSFEDLSGISIDGLQETDVNLSGDGSMKGTLSWTMRDGPAAGDVMYAGTLSYDAIAIGNGHASGGTFGFTLTTPSAKTFVVDFSLANNVDITHSLPIVP